MLEELYSDIILDHWRRPKNFGELEGANCSALGYNSLCGDKLRVQLRVEEDRIVEVCFSGQGCAIFTASASMMTQALKGKSVEEAVRFFDRFHAMMVGPEEPGAGEDGKDGGEGEDGSDLGELEALSGVRKFPIRVKCATLPWHAFRAALRESPEVQKTK